jgi:PHD/YefM family antitoxin component YafN of YafNO toxin-antitoxin module
MNTLNIQIPKFVSVSDLQRNYPKLLRQLHSSRQPLLVLKKNELEAVILLPEIYQLLVEKIRQYEEQAAFLAIKFYEKEKKAGKLKKMKKVEELFSE